MFKKLSVVLMLVVAMVIGSAGFAAAAPKYDDMRPTIVGIAVSDPNVSTLVAAVSKAGLVEPLNSNRGQVTVFAPTNMAFDNLAAALLGEGKTGMDLVNALDAETLKAVVLYHVAPGKRYATDAWAAAHSHGEQGLPVPVRDGRQRLPEEPERCGRCADHRHRHQAATASSVIDGADPVT